MSETFKPGQTVWRPNGIKCRFVGQDLRDGRTTAWIDEENDGGYELVDLNDLTATDPNAEPEPQKCPFCGSAPSSYDNDGEEYWVKCAVVQCWWTSPRRKSRLEAIQAWNSIRIIQPGEFTNDLREALKKAAADCETKPADSDPLTEEWLRKVGLWDGIRISGGPGSQSVAVDIHEKFGAGTHFVVEYSGSGSSEIVCHGDIKTIGDARTLCRLLGVPLKE